MSSVIAIYAVPEGGNIQHSPNAVCIGKTSKATWTKKAGDWVAIKAVVNGKEVPADTGAYTITWPEKDQINFSIDITYKCGNIELVMSKPFSIDVFGTILIEGNNVTCLGQGNNYKAKLCNGEPFPSGDPKWQITGLDVDPRSNNVGVSQINVRWYKSKTGEEKVKATSSNVTEEKFVTIVTVASVSSEEKVICFGDKVKLTAVSSKPGVWPPDHPTWKSNKGGTFEPPNGPITVWTPDKLSESEGDIELSARCGREDIGAVQKVTVTKIKEIKYIDKNGAEKGIPNPFYVAKGSKIKFKAISHINGVWPNKKPIWGEKATGNGETTEVTFSLQATNTEEQKISAKCGDEILKTLTVVPVPFVKLTPGALKKISAKVTLVPYTVIGKTSKEIGNSMGTNSPVKPHYGSVEYFYLEPANQKQEFDDSATIDGFGVSKFNGALTADPWPELKCNMIMPNWENEATSKDIALVKKWKTFYENLKTHEDGHVKINEDWATKGATLFNNGTFIVFAKDKAEAKKLVEDEVKAELKRLVDEAEKKQNDYDAKPPVGTDHGAEQGAVWTVSE